MILLSTEVSVVYGLNQLWMSKLVYEWFEKGNAFYKLLRDARNLKLSEWQLIYP